MDQGGGGYGGHTPGPAMQSADNPASSPNQECSPDPVEAARLASRRRLASKRAGGRHDVERQVRTRDNPPTYNPTSAPAASAGQEDHAGPSVNDARTSTVPFEPPARGSRSGPPPGVTTPRPSPHPSGNQCLCLFKSSVPLRRRRFMCFRTKSFIPLRVVPAQHPLHDMACAFVHRQHARPHTLWARTSRRDACMWWPPCRCTGCRPTRVELVR
jgi:hypothetical protein